MTIIFQPMRIATGFDEEGMLVLDERERLLAVLTHLSDENEVSPGQWYLEAGFGRLNGIKHPTFTDLDAVHERVGQRVARGW